MTMLATVPKPGRIPASHEIPSMMNPTSWVAIPIESGV